MTDLNDLNHVNDLTAIKPPEWLKGLNEELIAQQRAGTAEYDLPVLTVAGRRSGTPRHTPLTVLDRDGERFIVGGFPGADWIRNVRAAGRGTLTIGAVTEPVRLVELDDEEALPVLRAWPALTPDGVGMMRDAGVISDTTPDAMAEVVGICPVFRVERTA